MNARTQITMDPEMQRRAHAKAAELGISFAEYVRRLVADDLGDKNVRPDLSCMFDLGASAEPTNIARDKHKMIGEGLWEEYLHDTEGSGQPGRRRKAASR
jgi:hypothetical protein